MSRKGVSPKNEAMVGRVFGRLVVTGRAVRHNYLICRCRCGTVKEVRRDALERGDVRSCRCLRQEFFTKHGRSKTSIHNSWMEMIKRCDNKDHPVYKDYGGRGISVCGEWKEIGGQGFINFLADMGEKPSPKHTIGRIDNDGNYEPGNCRWETRAQQSRNTRRNKNYTANGKTLCLTDWAKELGTSTVAMYYRLKHWPIEDVFKPKRKYQRR